MNKSLNLNEREVTQKEREVAQYIFEASISFNYCDRFHYQEDVTLDLDENSDIYSNGGNEKSYLEINSSNEADDKWENKENDSFLSSRKKL